MPVPGAPGLPLRVVMLATFGGKQTCGKCKW
jgi:hypothetical protein